MTQGPDGRLTAHRRTRDARRSGGVRAVARLTVRLTRRGALVMAVAVGAETAVEAMSYQAAYPDAASRAALASFGDDPAIRIMAGVPHAVDTIGGFVNWDAGWILQVLVAVWALVTAARLLRGDEDTGLAELVMAGPFRASRALVSQVLVLVAECALMGAAVVAALVASGAAWFGAILFGTVIAGFGAVFVGVGAVLAQILGSRSRAAGWTAAVLAFSFVLRMVANSADSRAWLGWLTPLGWMDQLHPFGDNRWPVVAVPVAVTVALVAIAVGLRRRRDTGAGLLTERASRRSNPRLLGSPIAFAWRTNAGTLVAWTVGLAVWGLTVGLLTRSVVDFVGEDEGYRELLASIGMDTSDVANAYVALVAVVIGVIIALFTAWRIGAARAEEASSRLEHLVIRPVLRWRWLGGHVLLTLVSVLGLSAVAAVAMWLGGLVTDADLSAGDAFAAIFNTVPAVIVFGGLAVLVFGVAPRLTTALSASIVIVAYVVQLVGPALDWPELVLGLSPFHHLEVVPVDPFGTTAAIVMVAIGVLAAGVGMVVFERRDLAGA